MKKNENTLNVQPQSLEGEQAVLGSMLSSKEAVDVSAGILKSEHFYKDAHSKIFSAMMGLSNNNENVDTITVVDMETDEYVNTAPDMGCYEYGMTTGVKPENLIFTKVYPNPTKGMLYIRNESSIKRIRLIDISGKTIWHQKVVASKQVVIDISSFEDGIYFLEMLSESNDRSIRKVVLKK